MSVQPEKARKVLKAKRRNLPSVATLCSNMDWNIFFENPNLSSVINQILELLDYDSVKTCLDVSPIWKKYIDKQRFWRLKKFFALTNNCCLCWNEEEVLHNVKFEMSVNDLDILIHGYGVIRYPGRGIYNGYQFGKECPFTWSVRFGNFKFVDVLLRSPLGYSFKSMDFVRLGFDHSNTALHVAAMYGHIEVVTLILKHAEEKNIDINTKNHKGESAIDVAKDDPELIMLLMKHLKCDEQSLYYKLRRKPNTFRVLYGNLSDIKLLHERIENHLAVILSRRSGSTDSEVFRLAFHQTRAILDMLRHQSQMGQ